jgi:hypothetical protein
MPSFLLASYLRIRVHWTTPTMARKKLTAARL